MMRLMCEHEGTVTCITIFTHTGINKKIISMKTRIYIGCNPHNSMDQIEIFLLLLEIMKRN